MKSRCQLVAAVMGSFALGVSMASISHAQTKAPGYVVIEIDVKDEEGYTKDFSPKAQASIKEFGGKLIGGGLNKAIGYFGAAPPSRVVLLQFPDMDTVKAFEDKEGHNVSEVGSKYATFRVIGIEGVAPQ